MNKKKQIEIRCPWCGEVFDYNKLSIVLRNKTFCINCKKYSDNVLGRIRYISILLHSVSLISLFCTFLLYEQLKYKVFIFLAIYWYTYGKARLCYLLEPCERYSTGSWSKRLYPYPYPKVASALIKWESYQTTRITYLKWKVVEKTILPVCFVDDSNNPISQTYCIVVEESKIKRKNYSKLEFHFLLEDAKEDLLKEGNRFYIFNEKDKIGEGLILKSWYP